MSSIPSVNNSVQLSPWVKGLIGRHLVNWTPVIGRIRHTAVFVPLLLGDYWSRHRDEGDSVHYNNYRQIVLLLSCSKTS